MMLLVGVRKFLGNSRNYTAKRGIKNSFASDPQL